MQNKHNPFKPVTIQSADGEKQMNVDLMPHMNASNETAYIKNHLLKATSGESSEEPQITTEDERDCHTYSIKQLPTHLLAAYFTLRFMESRDAKTRIMYTLNYFRSI